MTLKMITKNGQEIFLKGIKNIIYIDDFKTLQIIYKNGKNEKYQTYQIITIGIKEEI